MVRKAISFEPELVFDPRKLEGTSGKLLDFSRLSMFGFKAHKGLKEGFAPCYRSHSLGCAV